MNNMAPGYLSNMFHLNNFSHSYNTRHASQVRTNMSNKEYYHSSFSISGPHVYNTLTDNIKQAETLNSFKNKALKYFMTKNQF